MNNELAFPTFIITNGGDVLHPNHEPQGNPQICRKIWQGMRLRRLAGSAAMKQKETENRHNGGGCQDAPAFKDNSRSYGGLFCQQHHAPKLPLQP
jgi:hypothetical protein